MNLLGIALAGALTLVLVGVAGWSVFVTVKYARPALGRAPLLEVATWYVGAVLLTSSLLLLTGGVLGLGARAVLMVLR